MRHFELFTTEEVAVLGVGLALAGTVGEMQPEAGPLLREVNQEVEIRRPEVKSLGFDAVCDFVWNVCGL